MLGWWASLASASLGAGYLILRRGQQRWRTALEPLAARHHGRVRSGGLGYPVLEAALPGATLMVSVGPTELAPGTRTAGTWAQLELDAPLPQRFVLRSRAGIDAGDALLTRLLEGPDAGAVVTTGDRAFDAALIVRAAGSDPDAVRALFDDELRHALLQLRQHGAVQLNCHPVERREVSRPREVRRRQRLFAVTETTTVQHQLLRLTLGGLQLDTPRLEQLVDTLLQLQARLVKLAQ